MHISAGMTSAEQENAIEKFKEGSCNVLVSTSVAQESLNIPKCNLIVCYDYSTDDVAHTQRKGWFNFRNAIEILAPNVM